MGQTIQNKRDAESGQQGESQYMRAGRRFERQRQTAEAAAWAAKKGG